MIKLEITTQPKRIKYLEFSQSLESIRKALQLLFASLIITEKRSTFSIVATVSSSEQLAAILSTTELRILSGAIQILGEKTEVKIHNAHGLVTGNDLRQAGSEFLKINQKKN